MGNPVQSKLLEVLVEAASALRSAGVALDEALARAPSNDALDQARYQHDTVIPAMETLRNCGDKLELLVDDNYWPLPTYREMLFIR